MSSKVFYNIACKQINEVVKPYGFKKYQRFFYRITEDGVVQQFCLLWLNRRFTIRFWLSSVYNDNDRTQEGEDIYEIIDGSKKWLDEDISCELLYNLSDETYECATQLCKQTIINVLLPYFEKTKSTESAYQYTLATAKPIDKYNFREIGFFLGMCEYEKAKEFLKYHIDNKEKWNKLWWREKEKEYLDLFNAIVVNDLTYIEEYKKFKRSKSYLEFKLKYK